MSDIITAEPVKVPTTVDVYVLMYRFGTDSWCASGYKGTIDELRRHAENDVFVSAWKIVKVCGLPIELKEGLVK